MEYAVIMAGGAGTRLWPLSRSNMPKQLLEVVRGKSLLQLSYERLRGILPKERIYICTASSHSKQVREALPELPKDNLLGEPVARDTANAVGFSAAVLRKIDPDAVAAIVTADHVIEPVKTFHESLRTAFNVVAERHDALVTFGIVPTHGHTGLGYIHQGERLVLKKGGTKVTHRVQAFREKPDKATADRYVESNRYYWNSGMFVWRCDTVLGELEAHLPDGAKGYEKIASAWGTARQEKVLKDTYPKLPKISIDYAVMEPASLRKGKAHVVVVEMPVQWLDIGSWPALAETLKTDDDSNAIDAPLCVLVDSDDNIIVSRGKDHLITAIGMSDTIIIHTDDVTMVCPKSEAQKVKELVARVKDKYGEKYQ